MPTLSSGRLLLPELPLSVVQERLEQDSFFARLDLPDGPLEVTFPPFWPGDALPIFPELLRSGGSTRQFVLIDRFLGLAVGLMGIKDGPDEHGDLKISYGLNPECWGQGYAAEALQEDGVWYLVEHNCPALKVARDFSQLCQSEQKLYADLLGVPVVRESRIACGASECRYRVG